MRRALKARDGGCRFPGCTNTRFVDGHHIKHWADGGETRLDNLVLLCRRHHRAVHEGGFGLQASVDGRFTFTRPDGQRLPTGAPAIPVDGDIERLNRQAGLSIDHGTDDCRWAGETLDLDHALFVLLAQPESKTSSYREMVQA